MTYPRYPRSTFDVIDGATPINSELFGKFTDAIINIQDQLGDNPQGLYSNIRQRLDAIDTGGGGGGAVNHNDLLEIQGGQATEYYHLTAEEYARATADGYIGFSNVLYVDVLGNDETAERGNISKPFLTISAAMLAAQSGDIVKLGPGTWQERVTFPELEYIALIGQGMNASIIDFGDGDDIPTINAYPEINVRRIIIADLFVNAYGAAEYTMGISGGSGGIDEILISNVKVMHDGSAGAELSKVGQALIFGCFFDKLRLAGVPYAYIHSTICDEGLTVGWYDTHTTWHGSSINLTTMVGCITDGFRLVGAANATITGSDIGYTQIEITTEATIQGILNATGCNIGGIVVDCIAAIDSSVAILNSCKVVLRLHFYTKLNLGKHRQTF